VQTSWNALQSIDQGGWFALVSGKHQAVVGGDVKMVTFGSSARVLSLDVLGVAAGVSCVRGDGSARGRWVSSSPQVNCWLLWIKWRNVPQESASVFRCPKRRPHWLLNPFIQKTRESRVRLI